MSNYELIIFDCDGTLVDSEAINSQAVSDVLIEMGYSKYTQQFCMEMFTGMSLSNLLKYLHDDVGHIVDRDVVIKKFKDRGSFLARKYLKATPNIHQLLMHIKHKKCVASNGERASVLESLHITGIDKFFSEQHVFTSNQVKQGKPAPDLFLFAAQQMGVHHSKCLVIEDSITGIKAAKAANMKVLGYTGASHNNEKTRGNLLEIKPDGVIENLLDVLGYL